MTPPQEASHPTPQVHPQAVTPRAKHLLDELNGLLGEAQDERDNGHKPCAATAQITIPGIEEIIEFVTDFSCQTPPTTPRPLEEGEGGFAAVLRDWAGDHDGKAGYGDMVRDMREAANLIEAQAGVIEGLREEAERSRWRRCSDEMPDHYYPVVQVAMFEPNAARDESDWGYGMAEFIRDENFEPDHDDPLVGAWSSIGGYHGEQEPAFWRPLTTPSPTN